jgi:hypothetical protein
MPALVAGIHVDGRVKPGHDGFGAREMQLFQRFGKGRSEAGGGSLSWGMLLFSENDG